MRLLIALLLACGWDYETFVAETGSLPCVEAVAVRQPPKHSPVLLQRRADVAELALFLIPSSLAAHDARTQALLHLGKLDLALASARARSALAPDDYGSRANLGTVLTFTGDLDAALVEVKAALAKEPNAHFGREKFHQDFLEYLIALKADPKLAEQKDFLGLTPSSDAKDVKPQSLDALLSMLGVYGAADNPHLLFALGNVLNAQGDKKLAFAAWKSALEKKHPAKKLLIPVMEKISVDAHDAWKKTIPPDQLREDSPLLKEPRDTNPLGEGHWSFGDQWAGLWMSANERTDRWVGRQKILSELEEKQLAMGLAVWTESGSQQLINYQRRLGFRCPTTEPMRAGLTPGMFDAPSGNGAITAEGRAWLESLEALVADVQDARSCEIVRPAFLERLKKSPPPKTALAARQSVLADPTTRERFNDVFDRLALLLSKCAPKSGNAQVLTALKAGL
ncbi:MAG: hypothetical protein QM817_34815 [Archangium sp.]